MLITIPQKTKDSRYDRASIILWARRVIYLWHYTPTDIVLNQYLLDNYKISLKNACLAIIMKCSVNSNFNGDMIITIIDKQLDALAELITFGTGKIKGSDILKVALTMTKGEKHGL